jgi:hypothetical protein
MGLVRGRVSGEVSGSYAINSGTVMRATIDETLEFEQEYLKVGSYHRDAVERSITGLDGVMSIDLGMRKRQLLQKGILHADSTESLRGKVNSFSKLMDGRTHKLVLGDASYFGNLRVDVFEVAKENHSGIGPSCNFEIRYTQLMDSSETTEQ